MPVEVSRPVPPSRRIQVPVECFRSVCYNMTMKILIATTLLSLAAVHAEAGDCFTPETSRLFERQVEPLSGHTYYLLKPVAGKHSRQSLYFTAKSMTDDGRFLMFWGYDEPEDGQGIGTKSTA